MMLGIHKKRLTAEATATWKGCTTRARCGHVKLIHKMHILLHGLFVDCGQISFHKSTLTIPAINIMKEWIRFIRQKKISLLLNSSECH